MTSKHAAPRRWLRSKALWIVAAAVLVWALGGAAFAFWQSSDASNPAAAVGDALPQGATPAGSLSSATTVSLSFARAVTTGGRDVTSYRINRYSVPSGGVPAASFTCAWASGTGLSCSEANVPGGVWYYTDTPAIAGSLWTGTESARSAGVTTDSQAPTVVATSSPAANANGWNNASVTVTLTATDEAGGSGVKTISYAVDGGSTVTVTGASTTVSLTTDGVHTVSYFATDVAGNAGSPQTSTVRIDRVLPSASATVTPTPNGNGYNKVSPVTVNLSASDAASGVASVIYQVDGGSAVTVPGSTASVSVTGDGTHTVVYSAVDKAGNSTGNQSQTVKIDTAIGTPTLSVPTYVNIANVSSVPVSGTAEANSSLTLTVSDAGAAHSVTQTVSVNASGAWSATTLNLTTFSQGTISYSAVATDLAGNVSAAGTASSTKDTTAPTLVTPTGGASSGNGNGLIENADTLVLNFTEALDPASLPSSPVTVTQSRSGNTTTLTIPGVIATVSNLDDTYQRKNTSTTASGALVLSNGNKTLTVTLSGLSGGGNATAGTASVTISPATNLRDVAGNGATGSATLATLW
ncbi:MAG: hypothetical protein JO144_09790 [Actinobacteria bacterium]|nr:hypothetical protein [Actinomycetota bacterium]